MMMPSHLPSDSGLHMPCHLAMVESLVLTAASQYAMRSHRKPRSLPSVRPHDTSRPRSASRLFLGNHAFPSPFAATRLRHEG